MNQIFAKKSFRESNPPSWQCPTCQNGTLALDGEDTFTKRSNAETNGNGNEDWWDPEFSQYVFSGMLKCKSCGESVTVVGKGTVDQEYTYDGESEYVTMLTPTYFYPALKVISPNVNDKIPDGVLRLLDKAHEICWADPDSALNRLRSIVEEVLNYKGVSQMAETKSGTRRLSLHSRISQFNEAGSEHIQRALLALKYVGNDGSHGFSGIKRKELLEVFSVVNYCLEKLFPLTVDDAAVLAVVSRLNENEGLNPRRPPIEEKE